MRNLRPQRLVLTGLVATLVLAGCDSASSIVDPAPDPTGTVVSDFSLEDENTTSPLYGTPVSPRDFLTKISGWYFGHAR